MSLSSGTRIGSYEVVSVLGIGGMGEVYRARDTRLPRQVALKVLPATHTSDPERLRRFHREAEVIAALNHPNIAALHDVVQHEGTPVLVMELVDGPTLAERIGEGPLPIADVLTLSRQIALALETAHDQGIIHRDLKPANIKLRPDGTVKVLDFGLARVLQSTDSTDKPAPATLTSAHVIMGTPTYMSPEQARGEVVDRRADVWAFGCIVFEMLTGRRAFAGEHPSQIPATVIRSEPDWTTVPQALPPAVQRFLVGCLRKDPKQRVRDIGDVRLALEGAFDVDPAGGEAATVSARRSDHWRTPWAWIAGILVASVAIAAVPWRAGSRQESPPVSFVVHAPQGSQFEQRSMAPLPALSRDGRQMAFIASRGATPLVWVQTLGEIGARALSGTENGAFPFWSPDGDFVAFAAGDRLKKIAVSADRAPQDVCTCEVSFGGTWSTDGTIVFAGSGGLYRVPAAGGVAAALTEPDRARGEFAHRFPLMLPDQRRYLYLVRSTEDAHRGIYLGSLDDPQLKQRLIADDSNVSYGLDRNGQWHLFFVRNLQLLAQPFDPASVTLAGDPIVVAQPLIPGEAGRFAPFAVGNRAIVYRQRSPLRTQLRWMDRRGVPGESVGKPGVEYVHPAISPNGTRVAVTQRDPLTGLWDVWLIDVARPVYQRLTVDPVAAGFPLWTPDGDRVIFASPRKGLWEIYSRLANGMGGEQTLIHGGATGPLSVYPRDITRGFLLFGRYTLWVQPLDGAAGPSVLLPAAQARVSPDGNWLAYTSVEGGDPEVYVTTFPTPSARWRISTGGGQDPQWRRDGSEFYYIAGDQSLMAVLVKKSSGNKSFEHPHLEPLFRAQFDRVSIELGSVYSPAPDGLRFLIVENENTEEPVLSVRMNWAQRNSRAFAPE